jgi:hypothetical protein
MNGIFLYLFLFVHSGWHFESRMYPSVIVIHDLLMNSLNKLANMLKPDYVS